MSSKPSFFRKHVRKFRKTDSGNNYSISPDPPNPASSEPIGGSTDVVLSAIDPTLSALKELSSLAGKIPYISPVAGIILQALKMKDEVKQLKEEWEVVMEKLHNVGNVVVDVGKMCQRHGLKKEELPSDLLTVLGSLQSDLDGIDTALSKCAEVKGMKKVLLRTDMLRKVKQYDGKLSNTLQVFQARLFLSLLAHIIQQRNDHTLPQTGQRLIESGTPVPQVVDISNQELMECGAIIRGLPYTGGWPFGDEKRCLQGTREDFLDYIIKWVENPESERALIILGQAGTGKSSIAHEIARRFQRNCLGSYFAFLRKEHSKDKTYQLFTTLACDLSDRSPAFKLALGRVIRNDTSLRNARDYRTLFEGLLLEPLKDVQLSDPILIVIDGLDESGDAIGNKGLHTFLAQRVSEFPSNFRILITSRPENGIQSAFAHASSARVLSMDDAHLAAKTEKDINLYLQNELPSDVFEEYGVKLMKAAEGLFQWVAVACGFINSPASLGLSKRECVQRMLGHSRGRNGQGLLDELYEEVLKGYFKSDEAQIVFRSVMGQLLAAIEPLSIGCLIALRRHVFKDDPDDSDRVLGILCYLGSLLSNATSSDQMRPIVPLHTSFRDFLTNKKSGVFYVDLGDAHHQLAHSCLGLMLDHLKFNICQLESSHVANSDVPDLESRIAEHIPPGLSYACIFWGDHLEHLIFDYDLFTKLQSLFEAKFLFWLEVLSVKNCVSIALSAMSSLKTWLQSDHEPSPADVEDLLTLVNDASAFVRYFGMPAARSAPHIYVSALPFAPTSSRIFNQYFQQFPRTLTFERGQLSHWPALEMTIFVSGNPVLSVAFSPDGKRILSASRDGTIRVWDAATGQVIAGPFTGHNGWVYAAAFSPGAQRVAMFSKDYTIWVWDAATGQAVSLIGHTGSVRCVAFSADGKRLTSSSSDRTIRVWDVASGQVVAGPFTTSMAYSVSFSPSGKRIASASDDHTIRVWDAATGQVVAVFTGHTESVLSVAFSPDGQCIASASSDHTIQVWDAATGQVVAGPFTGHTQSVDFVTFSPDGKIIASASSDQTIRVWDVATGQIVAGPFTVQSYVHSVAFSPDGQRIASASYNGTIRVWDVATRQTLGGPFTGHISYVRSVAFSPDGKYIASASDDHTIRVWDAATGQVVAGPFTGHSGPVGSVAFSPNGKHIASASYDETILVWDAATGQVAAGPFTGHTSSVNSVAFSPDGKHIASGSSDRTICVWDAATGRVVAGPCTGHTEPVSSVAFSPDGKRIASASWDGTIQVWDAATGQVVADPFTGHADWVRSVAFSPDGKCIASASNDETIRVWDAATGQVVAGPFTEHTLSVSSVAFSPDGQCIASASSDRTIRVWDAATGQVVAGPFTGHTLSVNSVAFSPDGQRIASGSRDLTIQVLDVATVQAVAGAFPGDTHLKKVATEHPENIRFTDQSRIEDDGWIYGEEKELLFWVPGLHRSGLHRPGTVWIAGEHVTRLDLSNFVHGSNWATVYNAHNL